LNRGRKSGRERKRNRECAEKGKENMKNIIVK
jgi:hypothetical protein